MEKDTLRMTKLHERAGAARAALSPWRNARYGPILKKDACICHITLYHRI